MTLPMNVCCMQARCWHAGITQVHTTVALPQHVLTVMLPRTSQGQLYKQHITASPFDTTTSGCIPSSHRRVAYAFSVRQRMLRQKLTSSLVLAAAQSNIRLLVVSDTALIHCSVLQRMLRRNPLAALSLQQPSLRTPSLKLADDMPFELDKEGDPDSPDGVCMHPLTSNIA